MKITVLGDTHIKKEGTPLPERLLQELADTDHIIHTGDFQIPDVFPSLKQYAPVTGVYGNVDGEDVRELVPETQWMEKNGWTIGVVHGHGEKKTTEKRALEAFAELPDILVFGHSHLPLLRYSGKTLLFNPGSLFYRRRVPNCSFGVLHLEDTIRAGHVFL
ncbi:metallophosphoesterase family protein [Salibacterium sp. K-3]